MGGHGIETRVRRIRGRAGFYGLVVGCLGIGIGATATVFAVADAALFRPLPFVRPQELVALASTFPEGAPDQRFLLSALNVMGIRDRATSLVALEALGTANLNLVGDGDPVRLAGVRSTPSLFRTLGVDMRVGRALTWEDIGAPVAVISEGLWRRALGAAPEVVGQTIQLDGFATEVVGVVPDVQAYPAGTEVWLPWRPEDVAPDRLQSGSLQVVGRLRPHLHLEDARVEMDRIARELETLHPDHNRGRGIAVDPLRSPLVEASRGTLAALSGSVALFLALASANVATLILVRLRRRSADMALRHALGASRGRILRDALIEGTGLALTGGTVGVALATAAVPILSRRLALELPGVPASATDPRVLLFTLVVSSGTVLIFSLIPALVAVRGEGAGLLGGGRGGTPTRTDRRVQGTIVAVQATLGVLLFVSAGGAVSRLRTLTAVEPGFSTEGTLTIRLPLDPGRWADLEERTDFLLRVRDRLAGLGGVVDVGASQALPVGDPGASWAFSVEDRPPADESAFEVAPGRLITPGYLGAAGISIVGGRDFSDDDRLGGVPVVIVSQALARRYWPGQDALGKRIKRRTYGSPFPWMTVVGVVADVRDGGPAQEVAPVIYMPYAQHDNRLGFEMSFVVRVDGPTRPVAGAVRELLHRMDPTMPVVRMAMMEDLVAETLSVQRSSSRFLGGFAALGLGLLALGVLGVTARAVQERHRELGIRVAVGAAPAAVRRVVLAGVLGPVAAGSAAGLALALPATAPIAAALGGALEPPIWILVTAPVVPLVVGLVASLPSALRASSRAPAAALRDTV